jgi:quercetin dioxygenase-like cupin family protein
LAYVRLYTGADGISHFADEELVLAPQSGGQGMEATLAVNRIGDVKGAMFAMLKAGATEDWHVAPRRQFMLCLRGVVEITAGDGTKRRIQPGQFMLLEDTTGKGHITHSAGPEDHVALAIPVPEGVPATPGH